MAPESGLRRLWSPWRMPYIQAASAGEPAAGRKAARSGRGRPVEKRRPSQRSDHSAHEECLFCRLRERRSDRADLVLARKASAFLMLNRFPYNPAHLMVAVTRHVARFAELTPEERSDLLDLTALAEQALAAEYRPDGLNYGANAGRVAGAGFPGHLHLHLVPRWNGDTNFMPTIAETRVLPESLSRTWSRLRRALAALERTSTAATARGRGR